MPNINTTTDKYFFEIYAKHNNHALRVNFLEALASVSESMWREAEDSHNHSNGCFDSTESQIMYNGYILGEYCFDSYEPTDRHAKALTLNNHHPRDLRQEFETLCQSLNFLNDKDLVHAQDNDNGVYYKDNETQTMFQGFCYYFNS